MVRHSIDTHYLVLRPDLFRDPGARGGAGREERVSGHLAAAFSNEEPAAQMWEQFSDLGPLERHVIDNTHLDARQTADLVWSRYCEGTDRL